MARGARVWGRQSFRLLRELTRYAPVVSSGPLCRTNLRVACDSMSARSWAHTNVVAGKLSQVASFDGCRATLDLWSRQPLALSSSNPKEALHCLHDSALRGFSVIVDTSSCCISLVFCPSEYRVAQ